MNKYFNDNPPRIYFENQSSLEGNLFIEINKDISNYFNKERIISENWKGVNISRESQTNEKLKDSIQYHIIEKLKKEK